jgi:hypothetical protein
MLCEHALDAFSAYGLYDTKSSAARDLALEKGYIRADRQAGASHATPGSTRGFLLNYEALPGEIACKIAS